MMPVVSVVIPTHNRKLMLKRALDSVLNQTLKEIEVIVVDNASVDGTEVMVKSIPDGRISYFRHEINEGGPAARNTGIKKAKATLISLLDDDDEWFPEKLALQVAQIKNAETKIGLVYAGSEIYDETTQKILRVHSPRYRGRVYEQLLLNNILSSASMLIKKECFDKVGVFDETLTSCQDWDMWLRIAEHFEFDYIDEVLVRINMHTEQISNDYAQLIPGRTRMVQKHAAEFKKYPKIYVVHLKRIGKLYCLNGTWSKSLNWFQQAIAVNPLEIFKITAWVLLEWPWVNLFSKSRNFKKYK